MIDNKISSSISERFTTYLGVNSQKNLKLRMTSPVEEKEAVELFTVKYFALCGIGGILSCGLTHTGITTLDMVKCRMQVLPETYPGLVSGLKEVSSLKGGMGKWVVGWGPTAWGYSLQGLFKFGGYEVFEYLIKDKIIKNDEVSNKYGDLVHMASAACAELLADLALCPFEATKVRVQVTDPRLGKPFAKGVMDGLPKIYRHEGLNGLYQGLVPLWARQVPYTIIKFVAFERVVNIIYSMLPHEKAYYNYWEQLAVTFSAGYVAGVICGLVSHPADTMVSKLNQLKGTSLSTGQAVSKIYGEIGFMGLWKGLFARIIMIGTLTGFQWFIFDSYKVYNGFPSKGH